MATIATERVLSVHHWNETVFSFTTTRDQGLRFENGHFIMLGLRIDEKPVMRAYSIASANHEEHLELAGATYGREFRGLSTDPGHGTLGRALLRGGLASIGPADGEAATQEVSLGAGRG